MTRRRLVVLVSAAVLFTLGIAAFAAILVVTRTEYGHEQIRKRIIVPFLAGAVDGKVFVGRVGGNFLDSLTLDSLAIYEKNGKLFVSTGHMSVKFDPRDIWDRRIFLRRLTAEHPYVHFVQRESGEWNYNEVFKRTGNAPQAPKSTTTRGWGSYFVIDSASARNASFVLTMPWHVDPTLRGAALDSALRYNLSRTDHDIDREGAGYTKTYTWRRANALVSHARLSDPDSNQVGREIKIAALEVEESDPPFHFRNVNGVVRHQGDSAWFQVPHFDLPASTGVASGKVFWGSGHPIHYDILVRGDSVALNDVNWVYPYLPRTGGGSMLLHILNDPKNPAVIDYKLTKLDVRSTKSHLMGAMSFGVGLPVLLVRDVDLRADPVDFELIKTFNGKPFPVDWRGQVVGTVKGRGGLLTNFEVDDARGVFYDAHVPGATTRFTGKGELDILQPALTVFHGFDVTVSPLDLRTVEYLYPSFLRLGGTVSGSATLDSSWLDVRFSNARLSHQDGPGEPTRVSGSGRITYGPLMIYDVELKAEPANLTMIARSPEFVASPFRGLVSGPVRAKGTTPDLDLAFSLQGPGGAVSFEGRADLDSIGGLGAHGSGQFSGLDLRELLGRATLPAGTLSGHYNVDLAGATPADVHGKADLAIERTIYDGLRVYPSHATLRFADGRMFVDSLDLRTTAFTATATGALGLPKGKPGDSLVVTMNVDSLGGFRRYLAQRRDSTSGVLNALVDSLAGRATGKVTITGRLDSLDFAGSLRTTEKLFVRGFEGFGAVTFDIRNFGSTVAAPSGTLRLQADSVMLAGIAFDTLDATVTVKDTSHVGFVANASRRNGPRVAAGGELSSVAGVQTLLLQSLQMEVAQSQWRLAQPATLVVDSARGITVDSLVLRNADSALVTVKGNVPETGPAIGMLQALHIPLSDVGQLASFGREVKGLADLAVRVSGTKARPIVVANASLKGVESGSLGVDGTAGANYENGRWNGALELFHAGKSAVTAKGMLPMQLTLFSASIPDDSAEFHIRADSADLAIVQMFASKKTIDSTRGTMEAKVDIAGKLPWKNLTPSGSFAIKGGHTQLPAMGIKVTDIIAIARFQQDKLVIDTMSASSDPGRPGNAVWLKGSVDHLLDNAQRNYDLTLRAFDFHPIDRRTKAKLDISIPSPGLRLAGTPGNVTFGGTVVVERGQVFLPDPALASKQLLEVSLDTAVAPVDPAVTTDALLARFGLRSAQITVSLGEDVKLKSPEADVKLTGSVAIGVQRNPDAGVGRGLLYTTTTDGALQANSGTYTLNLGLARRDFTVTRGLVTFDPFTARENGPFNPDIDISAIYRVKRAQKEDIGVIVNVKGPLKPGPRIDFSSDQTYDISQSDLLSYLITNEPGFDFTSGAGAQVYSFVLPTLSSIAASAIRDRLGLGSVFDLVQFQGAAPNAGAGGQTTLLRTTGDFFYGATLNGQKQVGNNMFFSLSAGLCPFKQDQGLSPLDAFGGSLDYRFSPRVSLQASAEQATQARYCTAGAGGSLTSLAPTPRQYSLTLRRTWRF